MKPFIFPYKEGSASAKELAKALGTKRIKREGSRFKHTERKLVVNWGSSELPKGYLDPFILNKAQNVKAATNKLLAFQKMQGGVNIPWFTTDWQEAIDKLEDHDIVARRVLTGHGGDGIVITGSPDELPKAPLYVEYIKKKEEYRVHIFKGEVILIQRKVRRAEVPNEDVNWKVRNHANGFIYQLNNINPPVAVIEQAVKAIAVLGLDFGAIDVIYNQYKDLPVVLEVNCAPGLQGTTLERYRDAIISVTKGQ